MPAPQAITTQVARIAPGGFPEPMTLVNTGTVTIWLGQTFAQGRANEGFPLDPASWMVWDAGRPLYASVAAGTSVLAFTENQGAIFSGAGVASQIIAQGLTPAAIASAITGGVTLSPSAIASQINVQGVPIVDAPINLSSSAGVTNGGNVLSTAFLNVAKYQSLLITPYVRQPGAPAAAPTTFGSVRIAHRVAGQTFTQEHTFLDDNGAPVAGNLSIYETIPQIWTPAYGDQVAIQVDHSSVGLGINLNVAGSFRPINKGWCYCGHGYWRAGGVGAFAGVGADLRTIWNIGAQPNASTWNEYPRTYSGPAVITVDTGAAIAAAGLTVTVRDPISGQMYGPGWTVGIVGARSFFSQAVQLPNGPIQLRSTNNTGAALPANATITVLQGELIP